MRQRKLISGKAKNASEVLHYYYYHKSSSGASKLSKLDQETVSLLAVFLSAYTSILAPNYVN